MTDIVSVFVAESWTDRVQLRLFAQRLVGSLVFLTDESTEGNQVLLRELRCSKIVAAVVRTPGNLRSLEEREKARGARDASMADVSVRIFDFGDMPGGQDRFPPKRTILFQSSGG